MMKETAKEKRFRNYIVELYKTIKTLESKPKDWVLIPIEPTENVGGNIDALLQKARYETSGNIDATVSAQEIYQAVIEGAAKERDEKDNPMEHPEAPENDLFICIECEQQYDIDDSIRGDDKELRCVHCMGIENDDFLSGLIKEPRWP